MNHQQKLLEIYKFVSKDQCESKKFITESRKICKHILDKINLIGANSSKQKGVYTVLVTLLIHKSIEICYVETPHHLLEVIEIKYQKLIDKHMVAIAQEKIAKFNPERYLILSSLNVKKEDEVDINRMINEIANNYQCQVIVNGILPTLKYYLRLVSSLAEFINNYSALIEKDQEINFEHKQKWNEILSRMSAS